ncbi:MAG: hypothetical protein J6B39_06560 [Lachnospiraceae bacterium]|nr:hypothetical protein [Lachnospiraceae bacterium]
MKKRILMITIIAALSASLFLGCSGNSNHDTTSAPITTTEITTTPAPTTTTHTHSYTESIAEATCEADGIKTFICACGNTYTEVIPKLGHDYNSVITAPTCTEAGFTTHTCSRCGNSYVDTEVAATGHTYDSGIITTEATCEADGIKTFTCACGDSYTESIAATGHNYEAVADSAVKATCTKDGKEADTKCSNCGNVIAGAAISATGHSYGLYVYNNDATQKADGTKSRTCSTCGKVDTTTAKGTKLPFDPYSLRAITSLDEIPVLGTMTDSDTSEYTQISKDIRKGKYEKVRYIASNGEQFCLWNVRVLDTRDQRTSYYWFVAPPVASKFSDGYNAANLALSNAASADKFLINVGMNISGSFNECMLNRNESIPLGERTINTAECPVELYKIVDTGNMISVWVESTNCGQEGIGTCGSFDCTGTCLRSRTLDTLNSLRLQKGWLGSYGGENGRINWNGKLLVNFYYMPR